jgi:hypothetical protein
MFAIVVLLPMSEAGPATFFYSAPLLPLLSLLQQLYMGMASSWIRLK